MSVEVSCYFCSCRIHHCLLTFEVVTSGARYLWVLLPNAKFYRNFGAYCFGNFTVPFVRPSTAEKPNIDLWGPTNLADRAQIREYPLPPKVKCTKTWHFVNRVKEQKSDVFFIVSKTVIP